MAFFDDEQNRVRLRDALALWLGTPYRHAAGVRGAGADCIHFVARALEDAGYRPVGFFRIPEYARDWHLHHSAERLLSGVMEQLSASPVARPEDGDIALLKFGRAVSHAGIYCGGFLYHAVNGMGVVRTRFSEPGWKRRVRYVLRLA